MLVLIEIIREYFPSTVMAQNTSYKYWNNPTKVAYVQSHRNTESNKIRGPQRYAL